MGRGVMVYDTGRDGKASESKFLLTHHVDSDSVRERVLAMGARLVCPRRNYMSFMHIVLCVLNYFDVGYLIDGLL